MNLDLTDEQQQIRAVAREFAQRELAPQALEWDEAAHFPRDVFNRMGALGFAGMLTPEEYGGAGADTLSYILMLEEINKVLPAMGTVVSVHNSLASYAIVRWGTPAQRQEFLPRLASGEWLGGYALSEAHAGSDPASMRTLAVRVGDEYRITGTKTWITSGQSGDVFILFAVTDRQVKPARGISAFILPKNTPGLSVGPKERKMGIRASETTQLILEDARLPARLLLGPEGEGFKLAMSLLDGGRIGIAAQGLGIAEGAYEAAAAYALQREQFGKPIAEHQAIQFMLADMATGIAAGQLLLYRAAVRKDRQERVTSEAAMAKLFCSELAMRCAHDAVQIHGGYGYVKEYPVERMFRDAKITEIYEGTSQVQRMVIAGQLLK
ncbi:MAG TPA: acyl-CoA dehydrogenase family protein [Chloroflexia bacterium]|nr:acyl-CoA dehydrogenase family protein [Chloroflexia bacterium]